MGMGWKMEERITARGGKRGQEGDDEVDQSLREMGGSDRPRLLRTGTRDAELPDGPFHTKSESIPLPRRRAGCGCAGP